MPPGKSRSRSRSREKSRGKSQPKSPAGASNSAPQIPVQPPKLALKQCTLSTIRAICTALKLPAEGSRQCMQQKLVNAVATQGERVYPESSNIFEYLTLETTRKALIAMGTPEQDIKKRGFTKNTIHRILQEKNDLIMEKARQRAREKIEREKKEFEKEEKERKEKESKAKEKAEKDKLEKQKKESGALKKKEDSAAKTQTSKADTSSKETVEKSDTSLKDTEEKPDTSLKDTGVNVNNTNSDTSSKDTESKSDTLPKDTEEKSDTSSKDTESKPETSLKDTGANSSDTTKIDTERASLLQDPLKAAASISAHSVNDQQNEVNQRIYIDMLTENADFVQQFQAKLRQKEAEKVNPTKGSAWLNSGFRPNIPVTNPPFHKADSNSLESSFSNNSAPDSLRDQGTPASKVNLNSNSIISGEHGSVRKSIFSRTTQPGGPYTNNINTSLASKNNLNSSFQNSKLNAVNTSELLNIFGTSNSSNTKLFGPAPQIVPRKRTSLSARFSPSLPPLMENTKFPMDNEEWDNKMGLGEYDDDDLDSPTNEELEFENFEELDDDCYLMEEEDMKEKEEAAVNELAREIYDKELNDSFGNNSTASSSSSDATSSTATSQQQKQANFEKKFDLNAPPIIVPKEKAGLLIKAAKYELIKKQAGLCHQYEVRMKKMEHENAHLKDQMEKNRILTHNKDRISPRKSEESLVNERMHPEVIEARRSRKRERHKRRREERKYKNSRKNGHQKYGHNESDGCSSSSSNSSSSSDEDLDIVNTEEAKKIARAEKEFQKANRLPSKPPEIVLNELDSLEDGEHIEAWLCNIASTCGIHNISRESEILLNPEEEKSKVDEVRKTIEKSPRMTQIFAVLAQSIVKSLKKVELEKPLLKMISNKTIREDCRDLIVYIFNTNIGLDIARAARCKLAFFKSTWSSSKKSLLLWYQQLVTLSNDLPPKWKQLSRELLRQKITSNVKKSSTTGSTTGFVLNEFSLIPLEDERTFDRENEQSPEPVYSNTSLCKRLTNAFAVENKDLKGEMHCQVYGVLYEDTISNPDISSFLAGNANPPLAQTAGGNQKGGGTTTAASKRTAQRQRKKAKKAEVDAAFYAGKSEGQKEEKDAFYGGFNNNNNWNNNNNNNWNNRSRSQGSGGGEWQQDNSRRYCKICYNWFKRNGGHNVVKSNKHKWQSHYTHECKHKQPAKNNNKGGKGGNNSVNKNNNKDKNKGKGKGKGKNKDKGSGKKGKGSKGKGKKGKEKGNNW